MNTSQPKVNLPTSTGDATTETALSTPLNPFNVALNLNEATVLQGREPEAPTPLNPALMTPPPTVVTHAFSPKEKTTADSFCKLLRR